MIEFRNTSRIQLSKQLLERLAVECAAHLKHEVKFQIIDINPAIGSDLGAINTTNMHAPIIMLGSNCPEATLIHEIQHFILKTVDLPTIKGRNLSTNSRFQQTYEYLMNRNHAILRSTMEHHRVFPMMEKYDFDRDKYFREKLKQDDKVIENINKNSRNEERILNQHQIIITSQDHNYYPTDIKVYLRNKIYKYFPDSKSHIETLDGYIATNDLFDNTIYKILFEKTLSSCTAHGTQAGLGFEYLSVYGSFYMS